MTLSEAYEAVYVDEFGEVDLLIEDEIIILSIAPVHDPEHCDVSATDTGIW